MGRGGRNVIGGRQQGRVVSFQVANGLIPRMLCQLRHLWLNQGDDFYILANIALICQAPSFVDGHCQRFSFSFYVLQKIFKALFQPNRNAILTDGITDNYQL
jgi:hypothetical protein